MRFSNDEEFEQAHDDSMALLSEPRELEFDAGALALVAQTGGKSEAEAISTLITAAVTIAKESTAYGAVLVSVAEAAVESLTNDIVRSHAEWEMELAFEEFAATGDFSAIARALGFGE